MSSVKVRFDVFVKRDTPYEMSGYMMGYSAGAQHRRVLRSHDATFFRLPSFIHAGKGMFRQPRPFADAVAKRAIEAAAACYIVEYEGGRADTLWYLDAAIKLVEDIAKQCGGVVVDRTADVFFSKAAFAALRKGVSVRDTVSLRETPNDATVTFATEGMSKYGQQDFVLAAFPVELSEMARRLLYDNLCSYSMNHTILAGQTFGGSTARMIFVEDAHGRLEVRDVHAREKKALAGTENLVAALRSIWAAQATAEAGQAASQSEKVPKRKASPKKAQATNRQAARKAPKRKAAPKKAQAKKQKAARKAPKRTRGSAGRGRPR